MTLTINDYIYGNQFESYGKCKIIKKEIIRGLIFLFCFCTIGTNWIPIVFAKQIAKIQDMRISF